MEATYGDASWLPPEHLHPRQDEHFEVLEGTMRAIVGGTERSYGPGEPHQMASEGPARVRWEVRPALRTAEFFERLHGDGDDSARAAASIAVFLAEFSDEIRMTGA